MFEVCSIPIDGQPKRGVKIKCGHCDNEEAISVNYMKTRGDDDDVIERQIAHKFEKHGWKVGRTPSQHRCPACFSAIKISSARKSKEHEMENGKVVSITPTPAARTMTRDERYLIFTKIDENYDRNKGSYTGDWSDDKIAKDFNVPRIWVSTIRDDNFGPDTNEQTVTIIAEAKSLLENIKATELRIDPLVKEMSTLTEKADKMLLMLRNIEERK